jgi:hypothetical protein
MRPSATEGTQQARFSRSFGGGFPCETWDYHGSSACFESGDALIYWHKDIVKASLPFGKSAQKLLCIPSSCRSFSALGICSWLILLVKPSLA